MRSVKKNERTAAISKEVEQVLVELQTSDPHHLPHAGTRTDAHHPRDADIDSVLERATIAEEDMDAEITPLHGAVEVGV